MNAAMEEGTSVERSIGRLEGKMDSMMGVLSDLKGSFESLEKGRLSRLEVSFNTLKIETQLNARNAAFYWAIGSSIVSTIIAATVLHYIG